MAGNPNCVSCHGRGGWRDGFGWHRCHCMRPSRAAQDALRKANARDDKPYQLAFAQLASQKCTCVESNYNTCQVHGF